DAADLFDIFPGLTIGSTTAVPAGTGLTSFTSSWPGSTVTMSLISPSGKVIDSSSTDPNVVHLVYDTSETFSILNPESGTWTVKLYGAQVAFTGEMTRLRVNSSPAQLPNPIARFSQTPNASAGSGAPVSFDASASTASSSITSYDWYFGDGESASGIKVSHAYAVPGTYTTQLVVTDAGGRVSVATGSALAVIKSARVVITTGSTTRAVLAKTGRMTFTTKVFDSATGLPVAGIPVTVHVSGRLFSYEVTCTAATNAAGVATCVTGNGNLVLIKSPQPYTATTPRTAVYEAGIGYGTIGLG
ncbi:MAG: PKD domain-containing protein, partial [Marmoricola sp.]